MINISKKKYKEFTLTTERSKLNPDKFEKYIEFRFELIRLKNSTLEKLTKLVQINKKTLDASINLSSSIMDYK